MADLNAWSLTGRLTRDAEYKVVKTGKPLLTCSIAVNSGWGEYKKTLFVKINQWGEKGANLIPYLKKGRLIGATGPLSVNVWTGADGKERHDLVVDTSSIQLLVGDLTQDKASPSEKREPVTKEEEIEEVPF